MFVEEKEGEDAKKRRQRKQETNTKKSGGLRERFSLCIPAEPDGVREMVRTKECMR